MGSQSTLPKHWLLALLLSSTAAGSPVEFELAKNTDPAVASYLSDILPTTPPASTATAFVTDVPLAESDEPPFTALFEYPEEEPFEVPAPSNGLNVEKPNMIMFMPDQLRYDSVGAFGNPLIHTPNIDAFAEESVKFTNMFAQASTCSQSRTSMFTGQYPHVSGHRSLENLLKPWEPNVFRSLKEGGYHVAYLAPRGDFYAENATELGVNEYGFLNSQTLPTFRGFPTADWVEPADNIWNRLYYRGERNETEAMDYDWSMVQGALQWLERPPPGPWVLFLPAIHPHPPFEIEEPWFSMHNRSEMPLPARTEEKTGHVPRFFEQIRSQHGLERATDENWQEVIAVYYGMISRLDHFFGQIVNKTKEQGLWDSTVTMFYTDHGEFLGDYQLIEKWPSGVGETLVHEPILIGGGGLPKGVVFEEMAEMIDLVPTLLQLGGVNETYQHYGRSMVDAMNALGRGEACEHKTHAFTEGGFLIQDEPVLEQGPFPYDIKGALQHDDPSLVGKALGIRDKQYTYVYRLYEADELYDRVNDVYEKNNLAALPEYAHIRASMHEVALKWMIGSPSVLPWYKDDRNPQPDLVSPYEQWMMRGNGTSE